MSKVLRLALAMLCFFVGAFVLSTLLSGKPGRIVQVFQSFITPGMPRLTVLDAQDEYRIAPLSQNDVRELRSYLSTDYAENQGIVPFTPESSSASSAGLQNQSAFQRQLSKIGCNPQILSVDQSAGRQIAFSTPPTSLDAYLFFREDSSLSHSLEEAGAFLPDSDGLCYLLVDAVWEAENSWQKSRSGMYCFALRFDRPASFSVSAEDIDPGELLVFYAEYLTPGEAVTVQSTLPLSLRFAPYGPRQMIALAPVSYDIHPGAYSATLSAGDSEQTFAITVKDKEFAVQYVNIDPQVAARTRTEETNKEFEDRINPILAEQLPELLWKDKAALPVPQGRVLSLFGSRRYINEDVNSYRHTGLDLEAPVGTEVRAVNDGKVLFADYLAYTGNTVLIEHGLGLKSWYYHMDSLSVAPGDSVSKSEVIGLSGQTGFAAEPQLHFNLSVGSTHINPVTAINQPLFREILQ